MPIDAARVATPTTLVAVREDQLVPIGDMRALAARLPARACTSCPRCTATTPSSRSGAALQPAFASLYGDVS